MFRKSKKIFKFLIGTLILNLPATLKVSAMEQKPKTDEYSNYELYNYSYEFSENKNFNDIFRKKLIDSIKSS